MIAIFIILNNDNFILSTLQINSSCPDVYFIEKIRAINYHGILICLFCSLGNSTSNGRMGNVIQLPFHQVKDSMMKFVKLILIRFVFYANNAHHCRNNCFKYTISKIMQPFRWDHTHKWEHSQNQTHNQLCS